VEDAGGRRHDGKSALKQVMECGSRKRLSCGRGGTGGPLLPRRLRRHGWWNWSIKPEGAGPVVGASGENGVHENGNGSFDASQVMPTETGAAGAEQPEPADEFGDDRFQRIYRAAVIAILNREHAAELDAGASSNGKPAKNGRRPKPR